MPRFSKLKTLALVVGDRNQGQRQQRFVLGFVGGKFPEVHGLPDNIVSSALLRSTAAASVLLAVRAGDGGRCPIWDT